ncbi:MAG: CCA tRNA nucleotidyltransferase [Kiritimatiellae bacterium]|nr:CCA tRNA nucleotidyltransferase [Kiritimatiellia bacterium]
MKGAGGRALLVGGCVRDGLLGLEAKDIDLEVFGLVCEDVLKLFPGADTVGKSFGVIKLGNVDVAFPRRETKLGQGHKAFAIASDPHLTLTEAAARRDFTVNAIYQDPLTGEYLDPYGGIADLRAKVLKNVSGHFAEDPLRVLRGMQFIARFELEPAKELVEICRRMTPEGLPRERLFDEWQKLLLQGRKISRGLEFLRATGWVRYYPELAKCIGCEQDPAWHPEGDVWNHTLECLDRMEKGDIVVALAVLCHDFGKPYCTKFDPEAGRIRSLGHDVLGVKHTLNFLKRLTREERLLKEVPPLVQFHMAPYSYYRSRAGDSAVRRLSARVVRLDRLLKVAAADNTPPEAIAWLEGAAERLDIAQNAPKPIVLGRHLLALGMAPGPAMGQDLKALYEAQLDGRFFNLENGLELWYNMHSSSKKS